MPNFINNKGLGIVPSLQTIVAVSPHLTSEQINQLPTQVARWTHELRRNSGANVFVNAQQIPLYIAGEQCSNNVALPYNSAQVDYTHPSAEQYRANHCWWLANSVFTGLMKRRSLPDLLEIKHANEFLASWFPRTETVVFSGVNDSIKSVPYADKVALFMNEEDWNHFLNTSLEEFPVTEFVQRIVLQDVYHCNKILTSCYSSFPRLTSIDICTRQNLDDWYLLSLFNEKLRELRLFASHNHINGTELTRIISRLNNLQVLTICYDEGRHPVDHDEDPFPLLTACPELRSLYLHNVHPITPEQIIHYLKEEVLQKGEMVERQEIFSDLTLIGYDLSVYEALYGSNDLSHSMKERIYCDKDIHHLSAAMVLLNQRNGNVISNWISPLFEKAERFERAKPQPYPFLLSLKLQQIRWDPYNNEYIGPEWLLGSTRMASQYDPALLSSTTATLAYFFSKRTMDIIFDTEPRNRLLESLRPRYNGLVHLLHRLVEDPPNIPAYLEKLVNLMRYDGRSGGLPGMFIKQAKKLTKVELMNFVTEREDILMAMLRKFICCTDVKKRAKSLRYSFPCPLELDDLLKLIMKSTKSDQLKCDTKKLLLENADIPARPSTQRRPDPPTQRSA